MKAILAKISSMMAPLKQALGRVAPMIVPPLKKLGGRITGAVSPLLEWWMGLSSRLKIVLRIVILCIFLALIAVTYLSTAGEKDDTPGAAGITGTTVEMAGASVEAAGASIEIPGGTTMETAETAPATMPEPESSPDREPADAAEARPDPEPATMACEEPTLDFSDYYWNLKLTMEELQEIIEHNPGNFRASSMLVYTYLQIAEEFQKEAYRALKELRTAQERFLGKPWLGNLFPVRDEFGPPVEPQSHYLVLKHAIETVRGVKKSGPQEHQLLADRVLKNMEKAYEQYTCALRFLGTMQARFHQSAWPYRVEGLLRLSLDEETDALLVLEKGAEQFNDSQCANAAGLIWMLIADRTLDAAESKTARKKAQTWLEQAIAWQKKLPQAHNNLGLLHLLRLQKAAGKAGKNVKRHQAAQAEKSLAAASKLHGDKNNDRARGNLAVAYYYKGKHKKYAENEIRQAYGRDPSTAENINNLGCMEIQWEESPLARDHLKMAVNWMPGNSIVWNNYGFARLVLGELDEAKEIFRIAGIDESIRLNLSYTYLKMKKKGEKLQAPAPSEPPPPGSIVDPTVVEDL